MLFPADKQLRKVNFQRHSSGLGHTPGPCQGRGLPSVWWKPVKEVIEAGSDRINMALGPSRRPCLSR